MGVPVSASGVIYVIARKFSWDRTTGCSLPSHTKCWRLIMHGTKISLVTEILCYNDRHKHCHPLSQSALRKLLFFVTTVMLLRHSDIPYITVLFGKPEWKRPLCRPRCVWGITLIRTGILNRFWESRLDSCGSVAGFCEHGNEHSGPRDVRNFLTS
jgi:hypothetical protein